MKVNLFPKSAIRNAVYQPVDRCPLCAGPPKVIGELNRTAYRFGPLTIPLPAEGVGLKVCLTCNLLFKDRIPTLESLSSILSEAAEDYWEPKAEVHPLAEKVQAHLKGGSLLDIGASNGDLLRSVRGNRLSAFDAVAYDACRKHVTGEYIISQFEQTETWSKEPYDVVSAFDVFEHFMDTRKAVENIRGFLKEGGHLILETGNWRSVPDPSAWYYTNLFEHQIFWSRKSLEFLASEGLTLVSCDEGLHKARLACSVPKKAVISALRLAGAIGATAELCAASTGIDPRLLPPVGLRDHFFAVFQKATAQSAQKAA